MKTIDLKIRSCIEMYDDYLNDQFEYPDEAKLQYASFTHQIKDLLTHFNLPNKQPYSGVLYKIIDDNLYEKKITDNLFQLSIKFSTKLSNLIAVTMEKFEHAQKHLSKMDVLFKDLYEEFEKSSPVKKDNLPKYRGIYVFYQNGQPIYVGRANNIRNRIQWHTRKSSGSESASFAFNLAKMEFEKQDSASKKKRAELMAISEFKDIFDNHKLKLSECEIKCVEIENDILQTMFEPYLALKLGTYPINNTFENH